MRVIWKLKSGNTAVMEGMAQMMALDKNPPPVRLRYFEGLKWFLMAVAKTHHIEVYSFSQYDWTDLPEKALELFVMHKPSDVDLNRPQKKKPRQSD